MIVCLYGRPFLPVVDSALSDLADAMDEAGNKVVPVALEDALAQAQPLEEVATLYILPFDAPQGTEPADLISRIFPRAALVTSFAVQELCWDKIETTARLIERGVPVPETLITSNPSELLEFVKRHEYVVLKERGGCGGQGHLVVWRDGQELHGDSGSHEYIIEPVRGGRRVLEDRVMRYPGPFYAQRMVGTVRSRRFEPGQTLRAYVIDNEVRFWTERYRDKYTRPSDWITDVHLGAKYRFVLNVSDEIRKTALRAAEAVGARIAAVDLIRTSAQGAMVLEVDTDSHHMMIDRQFKDIPEFREFFNLDWHIARALLRKTQPVDVRAMSMRRRDSDR